MPATFNPTFEVDTFVVTGAAASTGYVLQMKYAAAPTPIPMDPTIPDLGFKNYADAIATLSLAAVKNYAIAQHAYVVGNGPNNFTTDALALAAAKADCDKLRARRDTIYLTKGTDPNNPYATIGAAVYGPF